MEARLRALVRERADNRCEYCQRRQETSPLIRLQIEHIIPIKHGGGDQLENLALACAECKLKKSSDLAGFDPESNELIPLFHPRQQGWAEHFAWNGLEIVGLSAVGRTTVRVLDLESIPKSLFVGPEDDEKTVVCEILRLQWMWCGFYCGAPDDHYSKIIIVVPYWSMVLPLTLLSAWLLFSNPRLPKNEPELP